MENVSGFVDTWIRAQREFIETWMKTQKEFTENWVKSQKAFLDNWIEATRKLEEAAGGAEDSRMHETLNLYRSRLKTMADSLDAFEKEAERLQEAWRKTVEQQITISSEIGKYYLEFFQKAAEKE